MSNPPPASAASSPDTAPAETLGKAWMWPGVRGQIVVVILCLAARWIASAARQLAPDEAYYWVWSQHPAISYLDHPPVIAWLIRVGTAIAGHDEFAVRWPMGILAVGSVVVLTWASRRIIPPSPARAFVPMALLLGPIIAVIGSVATPDTPACFFQAAALACAIVIFTPRFPSVGTPHFPSPGTPGEGEDDIQPGSLWIIFGLLIGLALDSKYTSALTGLAVLLALLWTADGRRHLRTIWPWFGAIVAVAVFSPVLYWNWQNHWASFRFQLQHGMGSGSTSAWRNLLEFIGGQALVCTPVLLVICLAIMVHYWRHPPAMPLRICLLSATIPLVWFAITACRHRVEANWPVFAYFPGVILVAHYLAGHWTRRRVVWAEIAVKVALGATVVIHFPEIAWAIDSNIHIPAWDQIFGWRELAAQVEAVRTIDAANPAEPPPIFTTDYEYASELRFYLPPGTEAWPLPGGDRPTAYDFFPGRPALDSLQQVIVAQKQSEGSPSLADPRVAFVFPQLQKIILQERYRNHVLRWDMITIASREPDTRP